MAIHEKMKDEKLQFDINREKAKAPALVSDKFGKMGDLNVKKHYLLVQVI